MKLSLLRLGFGCFEELPEDPGKWEVRFGDVTIQPVTTFRKPEAHRLLLAASHPLSSPPVVEDGLVRVPSVERVRCEAAIQHTVNLLAVSFGRSGTPSTPTPFLGLGADDEEAKHFVAGCKAWRREKGPMLWPRVFTTLPFTKIIPGLADRLDGVALMAQALEHRTAIGKFHEFIRLFERAFRTSGNRLASPIAAFLGNTQFGYSKAETRRWIRLRDPATHADLRDEIVFEGDVRPVIKRMEHAALDVLLNKAVWRDPAVVRRSFHHIESGTDAGEGLSIIVTQGTAPRADFQMSDEFGVFPLDGGGAFTRPLGPDWWGSFRSPDGTSGAQASP